MNQTTFPCPLLSPPILANRRKQTKNKTYIQNNQLIQLSNHIYFKEKKARPTIIRMSTDISLMWKPKREKFNVSSRKTGWTKTKGFSEHPV